MELVTCSCGRNYNVEKLIRCPACGLTTRELFNPVNPRQPVRVASESFEVPPGWYPDPNGMPSDRYWDGNQWSEQTRPQMPKPVSNTSVPPRVANTDYTPYATAPRPRPNHSDKSDSGSFGTIALILGIVGLIASILGFGTTTFGFIAIVPCVVAISTGINALRASSGRGSNQRLAAQWGIALGGVGLMTTVLMVISLSNSV